MDSLLERWVPTILVSLLFFSVVWIVVGNLVQSILRPKVLLIGGALIALGILPLPYVRELLVGTIVVLFGLVHDAYMIVLGNLLG